MQWRAFVLPDGACGFALSCVTHLGCNIFAIAYCHSSSFETGSENRGLSLLAHFMIGFRNLFLSCETPGLHLLQHMNWCIGSTSRTSLGQMGG
jgi:hypothetical protein